MYNFVFFNDGFKELDDLFYFDIEDFNNVEIISRRQVFKNKCNNLLFRFHFSHSINSILNIPCKSIWYRFLFNNTFSNNNAICFVFSAGWYHPRYFEYLRKKYTNSKFVFFFSDTVESKLKVIPNLSLNYLKNHFDLVLSYNPEDVEKYNLHYTSIYYSKMSESKMKTIKKYDVVDVLYIGAARNRLDKIKKAQEKFRNSGLSCYFFVVSDQFKDSFVDGIHYSHKAMSFNEYLGRTLSAKCILEIVDTNTTGGTLRFWEAIMYNKKLITDYKFTKNSKFYNPCNIYYYTSIDEINPSFVTNGNLPFYGYVDENSPIHFLELIERYLSKKN